MDARLAPLRALLDARVVGHDEVKRALLLALVCREHVYLEGPPGSAKTMMAELAARGSALEFFFYQLHRDTRLAELVGDVVLERRPLPHGQGERIHQAIEPGGILTAEVAVLDDISRAPGEALNVLLRILNERKFGERPIPLLCAIATSNPLREEYYNEPLDPANLDRFALQLRVTGLLESGDLEAARALIDRFAQADPGEGPEPAPVLSRAALDALFAELAQVELPGSVRTRLLEILRVLVVEHGCDSASSLLTDRTFLVKAGKLLRGAALVAGRRRVEPEDLALLAWMTTFRVPDEVHEKVPDLIGRTG
jgi:MoxR-like ATPase